LEIIADLTGRYETQPTRRCSTPSLARLRDNMLAILAP